MNLIFRLVLPVFLSFTLPAWSFFPDQAEVIRAFNKNYNRLVSWQLEIAFNSPLSIPEGAGQEQFSPMGATDQGQARLLIRIWERVHRGLVQTGDPRTIQWRQEWILDRQGEQTVVAAALGQGQRLVVSSCAQTSFPLPLTWFGLQPDLESWSAQLGLALEAQGYDFVNGCPALCLGASRDQPGLRLCVDNEEFFPLLITFPKEFGDSLYQGFAISWAKYAHLGNFPLPQQGTLTLSSGQKLSFTVKWGAINTQLDNALFSKEPFISQFNGLSFPHNPLVRLLLFSLPQSHFQH